MKRESKFQLSFICSLINLKVREHCLIYKKTKSHGIGKKDYFCSRVVFERIFNIFPIT